MRGLSQLDVDVLIVGAGCAGMWLLDDLRRRGYRAVALETQSLGAGQTGLAQGILHSGLKYLFQPGTSGASAPFREAPALWQQALRGQGPDLREVRVRSEFCYLWRTDSLRSWLGMTLAKHGLQTRPVPLSREERPAALAACPGDVFRLDEPVIDTSDLLNVFAQQNNGYVWSISEQQPLAFEKDQHGDVTSVLVTSPDGRRQMSLRPRHVMFTAGEGNAALRAAIGLSPDLMQCRPLHVAFVVGDLPWLQGHCVDGAGTRVTITSARCSDGRVAWQLGGQISEDGVKLSADELLRRAQSELHAVLPEVSLKHCQWQTRRINRAELKTGRLKMPAGAQLVQDRNVLTIWPTKLALAPTLSALVLPYLSQSKVAAMGVNDTDIAALNWPAPPSAIPAWEDRAACRRAA